MTLGEFKELAQAAGFKVRREQYCVDISIGGGTCAGVSLRKFASGWVDSSEIENEVARADLISLVSEFANTPLNDRYGKVIAKHVNGTYVRQLTKMIMSAPAIKVEMTDNVNEANDGISAREREWLDDFFGDKISYIEEY